MDEDTSIINSKTRNEKIKNFLIDNKKTLISSITILIAIIISFYSYQIYLDKKRVQISNKYNSAIIDYQDTNKSITASKLKDIINNKDSTYSPLALYFIIDNNLIDNKNEINSLFDILIDQTPVEIEIKNLIIYKKALFNADQINEIELLNILNPLINSKSVWKSHALYLVAEFFYNNGERQKSKDFFEKIVSLENSNSDIITSAKRRLNRDLSE
ncbi:MAG: hypothetical protein CNB62_02150 [Pelagibacterales bacterium MED-G44]|nr:MAG: hypothetical protein CNB62_02150 [Pelagibacterales bacterium MED-G44]